jgi:hypothetical protein
VRLRRDGAVIDLTIQLWSYPADNGEAKEAEESAQLRSVTRRRLVKAD